MTADIIDDKTGSQKYKRMEICKPVYNHTFRLVI